LKVGAAYVPLDPTYPAERLSYMRDDSGVRVVLSHSELAGAALDAPVTVLLDREDDRIARQETTDLGVPLALGDLAYVIYTSGTTGRPKGVEVEHGSLANFIAAMALGPAVGPEDVVLFASALSFDISVLEIFHTLVHGARLVVADRETMLDGVRLAELIRTAGVTLMQATPITWRALIESGWEGEPRLTALCGGEAMSPQLARELGRRCSALWNVYGPTETTVWSTMQQIDPERDAASGTVPIGRPVANTLCYVLDARLQPVPIGVPGELFIGGQGTARGYHDRAELTAERFLPDPFVPDSRARMYRTGDICRLRADGNLEHLGRADHQVKVRGQRIELGEIEANLLAHAKVRSAVVTTYETTPGDAHLAAYYLAEGDAVLDAGELRDHLRRRLPAGLVPAVFVHLLEFPRTPSNKIDRKRLPLPTTTQADAAGPARPASDLERQLVAIWSNVLGGQQVGVDDDFFELGGHSLLATRITSAISASTGRRIPLSALFEAPTVRRLAAYIETDRPDGRWTSLVPMQPHGERPPFFYVAPYLITILSFAHLARHLEPDQPFYVLQPQGMDGDHPAHESIEEMATHYIAEMRQVQPSGPYRIGGLCAGSWVAFEMACQLQEAGEEVAALVVVDSEPPNIDPPRLNPVTHAVNRLRRYREDGKVLDSVRWQLQLFTDRYLRRYVGASDGRRVARLRRTHADAHRGYRGRTFHGDLVHVRSEDWAARPEKAWHVRWDELITGGLELDTVPGTHGDLSETESSASVARIIRRTVDRATNVALVAPLVLGTAIVGSDCLAGLSALAV
jgi:amino acid adenylation domain-containing protein